jgi:serine/threonine-protein kinase RsbW
VNETSERPDGDVVQMRVPADVAYVSTLRLAAAGLAARCELTIDDIEDLRLAVDEACALLLPHVSRSARLDVSFELRYGSLSVDVSTNPSGAADVDRKGFAWTVLGALASSVDITAEDGRLTISITKRREAANQ